MNHQCPNFWTVTKCRYTTESKTKPANQVSGTIQSWQHLGLCLARLLRLYERHYCDLQLLSGKQAPLKTLVASIASPEIPC